MKALLFSLLFIAPTALLADDIVAYKMEAACELVVEGNDYSGSKTLSDFDEPTHAFNFEIEKKRQYKEVTALHTVIPFAADPNKYQKYQIVDFRSNTDSLQNLLDDGIEYYKEDILGELVTRVRYDGYNAGKRQIVVDLGHGKFHKREVKRISTNGYSTRISEKLPVTIHYEDFGRDGFWGGIKDAFSDDLTVEDEVKIKRHQVDIVLTCDLTFTDHKIIKKDREPNPPAARKSRFSSNEIVRPKTTRE